MKLFKLDIIQQQKNKVTCEISLPNLKYINKML